MEKDLDRFEKLLELHSFNSLSAEDKVFVLQFIGSAEEYDAMRLSGQSLKDVFAGTVPAPDPAVLASLHRELRLKRSEPRTLGRWNVPAWAAALAVFIAAGTGWYAGSSGSPKEVYVDRLVTKTDTLRVASQPDTVFVERVTYRQVRVPIPASIVQPKALSPTPASKGVTMKEKEELEKLLVSGSL